MTDREFVAELVHHYNPYRFTPDQERAYREYMERYTPEERRLIRDKCFELFEWLPKISQVREAAQTLLLQTTNRTSISPKSDCEDCDGVGWLVVDSYREDTGEPYESVRPCHCCPKEPERGFGKGPGGWITERW